MKLEINDYLINIEKMFAKCQSIKMIDNMNTYYVTNMSKLLYKFSL